ncbi:hypothetical protein ACFL2Q_14190 [Thermodesulfobacteriota bacterium]
MRLCDRLDGKGHDAAMLLLATLFHDMGMLSQNPQDLSPSAATDLHISDVAHWVRKTHVQRLDGLVKRLFHGTEHEDLINGTFVERALRVAEAHQSWPWESGFDNLNGPERGLAAVVAIADLLDEDSNRCDTNTLIHHRQGSLLNIGHWIRHSLTAGRIEVRDGQISVRLVRPPKIGSQMTPVFAALRNHFRLVFLYAEELEQLGVDLLDPIQFSAKSGSPKEEAEGLTDWQQIPGLNNQKALVNCLLSTFMRIALLDQRTVSKEDLGRTNSLDMEPIDLKDYYEDRGLNEIRSPFEQAFDSMLNPN